MRVTTVENARVSVAAHEPGRGQAHARTLSSLASHFVAGYGRGLVPALGHGEV